MNVELAAADIARLTPFLTVWRFKPHRATVRSVHADQLFVDRITRLLTAAPDASWAASLDGVIAGVAVVERLDWDTRILGIQAGRLHLLATTDRPGSHEISSALIERGMAHARQVGVRHLSVRVDAEDYSAVHALEGAGFLNVDALMTFSGSPGNVLERAPASPVETRAGLPEDASTLVGIAATAFVHGRFHADPSIGPETARNVYCAWTAGCCDGSAADAVIVACEEDRILGFVACRILPDTARAPALATGTIPLIAAARSARGRGVGAALLTAAARWFENRRAATIEVGTQLHNVAAARLYERSGLRLAAGSLSFRKTIDT